VRYHHLYCDEAGVSHWRNVEIALEERVFAPPAAGIHVSEPELVKALMFLKLHAGWSEPAHPTPKRQTLVCLAGAVLVTAGDGEIREIAKGDVWRMEDIGGEGHHTRVIGEADFEAMVVQYD